MNEYFLLNKSGLNQESPFHPAASSSHAIKKTSHIFTCANNSFTSRALLLKLRSIVGEIVKREKYVLDLTHVPINAHTALPSHVAGSTTKFYTCTYPYPSIWQTTSIVFFHRHWNNCNFRHNTYTSDEEEKYICIFGFYCKSSKYSGSYSHCVI